MDRIWWATVHGVAKNWAQLSIWANLFFPFPSHGKHNKYSCPLFSLPPLASWLSLALLHVALPGMACWVVSCLFNGSCLLIFWPPGLCMLSHFSHIQLFAILWTVACQAPLSVGFSRQEYWSGLPFPSPGDIPEPGIEPVSLTSPALAGGFFITSATWEDSLCLNNNKTYILNQYLPTFNSRLVWPREPWALSSVLSTIEELWECLTSFLPFSPFLSLSLTVTSLICSRCSSVSQQPHCLCLSVYAGIVPLPKELSKHSFPHAVPLLEAGDEVTVWHQHLHCSSSAVRDWASILSIYPWATICQYPDPGSCMILLLNLVQTLHRWTFTGQFHLLHWDSSVGYHPIFLFCLSILTSPLHPLCSV